MTERKSVSSGISEQDARELEQFAEKNFRASQLSEVLDEVPSLIQRGTIYIIGAAILLLFLILFFGKAHVVVKIKGMILPEGEAIQVLALANGVATHVLAEAGDHLPKGSPIIRFSHTQSDLDLASMKRQLLLKQNNLSKTVEAFHVVEEVLSGPKKFLESDREFLVAGNTMQAIGELKQSWFELMKVEQAQEKEFQERMQLMRKEIELAEQNILLEIKNKTAAEKDLQYQRKGLEVKKQRYDEFLGLADRGFYSKVDVDNETERYRSAELAILTKEKEIDKMALDISNDRLSLSEKKVNLKKEEASAGEQYATARLNYQQSLARLKQEKQKLREETDKLEAEIKTEKGKIALTENQIAQGTVFMPHDGIITKLNVQTPGQSIGAGSVVAVMVADNEQLMVKASAKSKDVGFVTVGLPARVKVDAYPYQQFGTVPGRITKVYPNIGGDGKFTIHLAVLENKIRKGGLDIKLSPGLTVDADLLTRKQRLIYMLLARDNEKVKKEKN